MRVRRWGVIPYYVFTVVGCGESGEGLDMAW